jgi:type II secretory pathway pseudopilin PulG
MKVVMPLRPLRQVGDTIVEVIIVLAVLGLAISISYATANRSLQATRQAEENSQATELLQSQIEVLRSYAAKPSTDPNYIYQSSPSHAFCISTGGSVVTTPLISNTDVTAGNTISKTYTNYPNYATSNDCYQGKLYHIIIGYDHAQTDTFTARATWDDVTGQGQDTVTLVYRLHQP